MTNLPTIDGNECERAGQSRRRYRGSSSRTRGRSSTGTCSSPLRGTERSSTRRVTKSQGTKTPGTRGTSSTSVKRTAAFNFGVTELLHHPAPLISDASQVPPRPRGQLHGLGQALICQQGLGHHPGGHRGQDGGGLGSEGSSIFFINISSLERLVESTLLPMMLPGTVNNMTDQYKFCISHVSHYLHYLSIFVGNKLYFSKQTTRFYSV